MFFKPKHNSHTPWTTWTWKTQILLFLDSVSNTLNLVIKPINIWLQLKIQLLTTFRNDYSSLKSPDHKTIHTNAHFWWEIFPFNSLLLTHSKGWKSYSRWSICLSWQRPFLHLSPFIEALVGTVLWPPVASYWSIFL